MTPKNLEKSRISSIMVPQPAPQAHQHPSKIDAKMPSEVDFIFISIFYRFSIPTCLTKSTKIIEKPLFFIGFRENRPFEVNIDFSHDFDANLPPFSLSKSTQILSKIDLGRHQFFDRFFASIFSRFWLDFGAQLGAMLASKIAQGPPQMPPKTGLGATSRPDPLQASIFIDF